MGVKTSILSVYTSDLMYALARCLWEFLKSKSWSKPLLLESAQSESPGGEPAMAPCLQTMNEPYAPLSEPFCLAPRPVASINSCSILVLVRVKHWQHALTVPGAGSPLALRHCALGSAGMSLAWACDTRMSWPGRYWCFPSCGALWGCVCSCCHVTLHSLSSPSQEPTR